MERAFENFKECADQFKRYLAMFDESYNEVIDYLNRGNNEWARKAFYSLNNLTHRDLTYARNDLIEAYKKVSYEYEHRKMWKEEKACWNNINKLNEDRYRHSDICSALQRKLNDRGINL